MMKKLLFTFFTLCFCLSAVLAQETWDFANDHETWPLTDGYAAADGPVIVDNLGIYPHTSSDNFGQIDESPSTFDDGFTGEYRFKLNGGGGADPTVGEYIPVRRYLRFEVTGPATIEVWAKGGGSSERTLYITDGTQVLAEQTTTDSETFFTISGEYTGGEGNIYIFGSNNFSIYKIEVSDNVGTTTLSLDSQRSLVSSKIRSIGNTVYVSNVLNATEINVYSLTGALVKSLKTGNDIQFQLSSGLYVARLITNEGQKAVKLLTY